VIGVFQVATPWRRGEQALRYTQGCDDCSSCPVSGRISDACPSFGQNPDTDAGSDALDALIGRGRGDVAAISAQRP
jgi:hypothetical protein